MKVHVLQHTTLAYLLSRGTMSDNFTCIAAGEFHYSLPTQV